MLNMLNIPLPPRLETSNRMVPLALVGSVGFSTYASAENSTMPLSLRGARSMSEMILLAGRLGSISKRTFAMMRSYGPAGPRDRPLSTSVRSTQLTRYTPPKAIAHTSIPMEKTRLSMGLLQNVLQASVKLAFAAIENSASSFRRNLPKAAAAIMAALSVESFGEGK